MSAPAATRLGFIGLGVMGGPQASNVSELAAASDVVFRSLPGAPQVEKVLFGDNGVFAAARPGTIVVDLSTSPVALATRAGEAAAELGLGFVDAPVARTRQAAVGGTLSITAGGSPGALRGRRAAAADHGHRRPALRSERRGRAHEDPQQHGRLRDGRRARRGDHARAPQRAHRPGARVAGARQRLGRELRAREPRAQGAAARRARRGDLSDDLHDEGPVVRARGGIRP
ncbi:MAG: NAD(P)-dependent oxidoreductase [Microbacteriaceae bacterium]|nr:MAG: NAD(P)-dependent oxidoreductase [Microbacteriaceae bacterium]